MTVYNIQNKCMIVKRIRCMSNKTYYRKSLPHQISQIGTTIITALTVVIRIKLSSINQLSGDG
jgi:hypothetical protein